MFPATGARVVRKAVHYAILPARRRILCDGCGMWETKRGWVGDAVVYGSRSTLGERWPRSIRAWTWRNGSIIFAAAPVAYVGCRDPQRLRFDVGPE